MKAYPKTAFQKTLARLNACDDARKWVASKTLAEAWAKCRRAGLHRAGKAAIRSVAPRFEGCMCETCIGAGPRRKIAGAIRKAIPLSVIRAGLKP